MPVRVAKLGNQAIHLQRGLRVVTLEAVTCVGPAPEKPNSECCFTTMNMQMEAPSAAPKRWKKTKVPQNFQGLVDESSPVVPVEKQELAWLVANNIDVFASVDGQVGQTNLTRHDTHAGDNRPIKLLWVPQGVTSM